MAGMLTCYMQIRNAAADALYNKLPNEMLVMQNWSRPSKELKEVVTTLDKAALGP